MRNIKFYLLNVFLLCKIISHAQEIYLLQEHLVKEGRIPASAMHIFTTALTDTIFQAVQSKIIQPMNRYSGDLRILSNQIMWLKFIFTNTTKDSIWQLTVKNNDIRQMLLFNSLGQIIDKGGFSAHLNKPKLNEYCNLYFPLVSGQTDTFYLLINNPRFRIAGYIHVSVKDKSSWNRLDPYNMGKMEVTLLIYIIFTIVLFLLKQELLYFYYLLYALGIWLYYVASSGIGIWHYWGKVEAWIPVAIFIAEGWTMVAFLLTMRTFLELQRINLWLNRVLQIGIGWCVLVMFISFPCSPIPLTQFLCDSMNISLVIGLFMLVWGAALKLCRLPKNLARKFFLLEVLTLCIPIPVFGSVLAIVYCEFDKSGHRIEWVYNELPEYAILIEIVLIGFVLGLRVYQHIFDTKQAKLKVEKELQAAKDNHFQLLHNDLKNDAVLSWHHVKKKYPMDNPLIELLNGIIKICNDGQLVIKCENLGEFLEQLVQNFNDSLPPDAPLLEMKSIHALKKQQIILNLPTRASLHLFLKEALSNMHKYAKHSRAILTVEVKLEHVIQTICIELEDNGCGLPTTWTLMEDNLELNTENYQALCKKHLSTNASKHNGILEMFKITQDLKGHLNIYSIRDKGTILKLKFQLGSTPI